MKFHATADGVLLYRESLVCVVVPQSVVLRSTRTTLLLRAHSTKRPRPLLARTVWVEHSTSVRHFHTPWWRGKRHGNSYVQVLGCKFDYWPNNVRLAVLPQVPNSTDNEALESANGFSATLSFRYPAIKICLRL